MTESLAELRQQIALLKEQLREQWEYNHAEHCGSVWPHPDGDRCYWPPPKELVDPGGPPLARVASRIEKIR